MEAGVGREGVGGGEGEEVVLPFEVAFEDCHDLLSLTREMEHLLDPLVQLDTETHNPYCAWSYRLDIQTNTHTHTNLAVRDVRYH